MKYIAIFCFLIVCLAVFDARADNSSLVVEHIDLEDGLSNNFVTDIAQDKHGFIWVGTDVGLNRFDGENFKVFSEKDTRLDGNSINVLFYDDSTDKLWIGTKKGLNVLDCATQEFDELILPAEVGDKSINVVDFMRSADGSIYILNHYDFILRYNPADGKIDYLGEANFPGMPMSFRCITDGGHGNIYIGHANYGFSVLNRSTGKVENYVHKVGDSKSLPGNNVRTVLVDRYNNVWVGTDNGLALFNPLSKDFTTFSGSPGRFDPLGSHNVYSITESSDGLLWIGCDIGGVCILDIRDLSFANPDRLKLVNLPVSDDRNGISSVNVRSTFQDSFGNMWVGNYSEGLDFINRTQPEFKILPYFTTSGNMLKEKPVWALYTDSDSKLWVGGENEIVVFDEGGLYRTYRLDKYLDNPHSRVCALIRLDDKVLFSSFENGVFSLDVASGKVTRLTPPGDKNYANVFASLPGNKVYLGMQDGLYEYADGKINFQNSLSRYIHYLIPNGVLTDSRGNTWIGTYGDGIFIIDGGGKLLHHLDNAHGLASNAVKQLFTDSRGWVWVAGQDGLSIIKDTDKPLDIETFGYESGLNDVHIHAIEEDSRGNVWFSTNNGLTKWNKDSSKFENYDYHDGLPHSSFIDRGACSTPDGRLYFGSLDGICYFTPEHFPNIQEDVPVRIVECQNIIRPGDSDGDLYSGDRGEIKVPYDMNSLRILFSVPDYSQSRVVEYSYMVEGLDDDWIMAGREHEATLRNLVPGTYRFKVRARLRNQDWNDKNVASLKIIVTPPVWLTWYAKAFYVLLALLVIYLVVRFYKHRLMLKSSLEMERRKSIDNQQLNNERLRFYTNITHELRTPLTLILGPLEDLVADNQFPEEYRKRIKTIHASAQRLLNLINQILEFRKTETENRHLAVVKGQIATVVTEIGLRYKELNHNDKVSINLNIRSDIPEIYFDSDIIHTILNNLLSNAVKYTPEGTIDLDLATVEVDNVGYVEISVADTGYGIDAKALPHIFDRYYQAEGKHQASGTGIGLALVRSLSDLHEGFLTVESKVGKGTVFVFRLRIDNTYPDALHKENTEKSLPEAGEADAENKSDNRPVVLVIEDNDDIREYIETSLSSKYQTLSATNGKEGLELARKNVPDVIVSDIMMPVMDGMELCKSIKADIATSHIPVILLTAKDSIQDKEAGYEIGADSYLTKPFSAKLLINRIKNILESRRMLAKLISVHVEGVPQQSQGSDDDNADANTPDTPALKLSRLDEMFIQKFTRIVEDNITMEGLDMSYIQQALNMSHSTLYRKIKGLTGMSGNEFIRKIRLKRGYELLRDGCNVSEAAYSCGFNDVGYFRNCFKAEYGMSPSQFIKQMTQ